MTRKVLKLSGLLILCLVLSNCAPCPEPEIQIKEVYHYTKCPVDKKIILKPMDEKAHIGSAYNVNITIDNDTIIMDYVKSLESTIDCYEKQVKEEPK